MTPLRPTARSRRHAESDDVRFRDPHFADASRRPTTATRTRAKRTVLDVIRQLPYYLRLLGGLVLDRRVSVLDKALLAGAIAYIVAPIDLIPDFIPFLGEVDDVFLLMAAIERLVAHAGREVVADHWHGDPDELDALDVRQVMSAATVFLPGGIRARLVRLVRGGREAVKKGRREVAYRAPRAEEAGEEE